MELNEKDFNYPLYSQTSEIDIEEGDVINKMKRENVDEIPVDDLSSNDELKRSAFVTSVDFLLCLLYTSPSPRDATLSRMPSSA